MCVCVRACACMRACVCDEMHVFVGLYKRSELISDEGHKQTIVIKC